MSAAELFYDRGHHHEFLSLSQELAAPGEMRQAQTFDFSFKNVEKQYESYQGINVKLRYVYALATRVRYLIYEQIFHPGDDITPNSGSRKGTGPMGPFISNAARLEQFYQDGSRNRGLSTHRIRV